ncbi:hypothetical protein CHL78_018240 [Romboutsia weinsteinii]|uniref:Uncharacterized protein n=1 Tax=Romboutsia weinsteinii TaxID=2020949 RepID=A0A371IY96_9FIRM|nr:hypothetical protein [Romboutsia weinsteinii]RDY25436.1 hypothetical protein CHL78_018240 [Romboutsia weinsteinii]
MRWAVVFLLLYLIPLIEIFRNYKNFKRSCIYSSIYVVLVTIIVISNVYVSGLGKIKEAIYYQKYTKNSQYEDQYISSFDKQNQKEKDKEEYISDKELEEKKGDSKQQKPKESPEIEETINTLENDMQTIDSFNKEIYEIEKIALIPMRECMAYTKNIAKNLTKLNEIKSDVEHAKNQCDYVIDMYEDMKIPALSKEEYIEVLSSSRNDLIKTYELRSKAMESAIKLIDSKNIKYISKITQYLNSSDEHIANFKERLNGLKQNLEKEESVQS